MAWRKLFHRTSESDTDESLTGHEPRRVSSPHLDQAIERRTVSRDRPPDSDAAQRKLSGLRRQRQGILFDIEQGQLAASPDNPWTDRITLLGEALMTVTDDMALASEIVPGPFLPVHPTPMVIEPIVDSDVASVAFAVGDDRFVYSDDPDWAERGHQIARTELVRRSGAIDHLIPINTPRELRDALCEHLDNSLFVFASDLRDRSPDRNPLPTSPTLADLAMPCPVCSGWTDWRGACQVCARRNAEVQALKREESRLLDEISNEAEERHRFVEGLSLARTRLRNVEAELVRLGATLE